jgi:hypothetical protein
VAPLTVPTVGRSGFTLLPATQTGIHFTNQLGYDRSMANQNLLNGAGVCVGDYDQDGLADVYLFNLEGPNALYRNLGDWTFDDVTPTTGTACAQQTSRGGTFADVNGDGWLDLIVVSISGPNACLLNDGQGGFRDTTTNAGIALFKTGCIGAALADVDDDGDLDLLIPNNGENSVIRSGGNISMRMVNGKPQITGRSAQRLKIINGSILEVGVPPALFLNEGGGRFTPANWTDGRFLDSDGQALREAPRDLGLTGMFRDLNGDRAPDIYLCNDFQTPDRIWINDGKGHFRALPEEAIRTTCQYSMSVDFADIDRDGRDDFLVNDMLSRSHALRLRQVETPSPDPVFIGEKTDRHQNQHNTLQWNRGDGTYAQIAHYAGLEASDWTWNVAFLDVDLDGYEDVLASTGHAYDTQDLDMQEKEPAAPGMSASMRGSKSLKDFPPLRTPNYAFRNRGNLTFEEIGANWGFNSTQVCHGLALADLDNDGDLDVVVSSLGDPPLIYRNESAAPRLAIKLKGLPPNTEGIGSKIEVWGGAVPQQSQEIICGGRYMSGDQARRVFAAGSLTNRLRVLVHWRSGRESIIPDARPNCLYEIEEASSPLSSPRPPARAPQPLLEEVSHLIGHQHTDTTDGDLDRQPLLHRLYSRLGPGAAWMDVDGDQREDLVVGAAKGSSVAVYRNVGAGKFAPWQPAQPFAPLPDDLSSLISWTPVPGQSVLLAGLSSYESGDTAQPPLRGWRLPGGETLPGRPPTGLLREGSPGPVITADIDGDGALDLFVGGRISPGRYPEGAPSRWFLNRGGTLVPDTANNPVLSNAVMVSSAVFSDLDTNGWPDLVVACEWGPVRIYLNERGHFREATTEWGLAAHTGWWNGVTTGDLNGDGRPDIIAANWGLNTSYQQPSPRRPLRLYYGDFDGNGSLDLIEALTDPANGEVATKRNLQVLTSGWPLLRTRFPSHRQFSTASIIGVLGDQLGQAQELRAVTLASTVFINRNGSFVPVPLPPEAQFSPAFGVCVADLDLDGHEDVILAQNCFALRPEEPRSDAGRGLWLRGDGTGKLVAVPGQESGLRIYGEQRGAAVADYDDDGRPDLVVMENQGPAHLFHNQGSRTGLRVRLAGPPGNPHGVGAVLRWLDAPAPNPARELHGGGGYWSQDSLVPVLARPPGARQIGVRWPGGKTQTVPVPPEAREVLIRWADVP